MVNDIHMATRFDASAIDIGSVLVIVPARAGSKGLPGKNIAPLGSVPLVAWPIASALAAASVTRTIVTTDGESIARVARAYGADVPFMRPASLAGDDVTDEPVVRHTLGWLFESEGRIPEFVVQLRPTTPFRPRGLVDEAVALLRSDRRTDCVRGVTPAPMTPFKMWTHSGRDGLIRPLLSVEGVAEPFNQPRQRLPQVLVQTGHIDVFRSSMVLERNTLTGERVRPVFVDPRYHVDIDRAADLDTAERMLDPDHGSGGLDLDWPAKTGTVRVTERGSGESERAA